MPDLNPAFSIEFDFRRVIVSTSGSGSGYYFMGTRTTSTLSELYENGVFQSSNTGADSGAVPTNYYCSFARGLTTTTAGDHSSGTSKGETFGGGLDSTKAIAVHTRMQAYQAALGRSSA
jgi:hypothetical protein